MESASPSSPPPAATAACSTAAAAAACSSCSCCCTGPASGAWSLPSAVSALRCVAACSLIVARRAACDPARAWGSPDPVPPRAGRRRHARAQRATQAAAAWCTVMRVCPLGPHLQGLGRAAWFVLAVQHLGEAGRLHELQQLCLRAGVTMGDTLNMFGALGGRLLRLPRKITPVVHAGHRGRTRLLHRPAAAGAARCWVLTAGSGSGEGAGGPHSGRCVPRPPAPAQPGGHAADAARQSGDQAAGWRPRQRQPALAVGQRPRPMPARMNSPFAKDRCGGGSGSLGWCARASNQETCVGCQLVA
jgi:hypothetical protein